MALRKIAQLGEPVLRRRAEELSRDALASASVQMLIDDLIETMRDADGAGIAAPQVFESHRICVIEVNGTPRYPSFPSLPLLVLVNPVVEARLVNPLAGPTPEETVELYEGCLSVRGLRGRVRRPRHVLVNALDRRGEPVTLDWQGVPAAIVQHEVDHLDGVLFVDRAEPGSLIFQREFERFVPPEARVIDHGRS
ncbi:MAG: peptide deformylase [Sorangiineae bacterium]|nr:peptide deformylase [Polyangiaceae bacterium]MEB2322208.1 peptide deformylase [Sorangiineae bacterium]